MRKSEPNRIRPKHQLAREKTSGISEWSEEERSESKRNGKIPLSKNSQEVLEKPKRRRFGAVYKAQIVQEAEGCTEPGQIGALLRREGLYSSQLVEWRKQYRASAQAGLQEKKRGRKPKPSVIEKENDRLRKQVKRLEARLDKAETIIDIQKKISKVLGLEQPPLAIEDDN